MSALKTSLTANFGLSSGDGELSLGPLAYPVGVGSVALKLVDTIPTGALQLFSTYGGVSIYGGGDELVKERLEVVTKQKVFTSRYGESVGVVLALDDEGGPVYPVILPDTYGRVWTSDIKFTGLIRRGAYTRPYMILRYTPTVAGLAGGAALITYGTVAAYKAGRFATYDPEPLGLLDVNDKEVYRVTSKSVVNDQGQWEFPPGWPATNTYPGGGSPQPEEESGVVTVRVHEICMVNDNAYTYVRNYPIFNAQPFTGNVDWKPVLTFTEASMADMTPLQQGRALDAIAARRAQPFTYGIYTP